MDGGPATRHDDPVLRRGDDSPARVQSHSVFEVLFGGLQPRDQGHVQEALTRHALEVHAAEAAGQRPTEASP